MKIKLIFILTSICLYSSAHAGEVKTHIDRYNANPGTVRCVTFTFVPAFADVTARIGRYEKGKIAWYGVSLMNSTISPI